MISIKKVQEIISNTNPHDYYQTYRKYEPLYWKHIPGWILEYAKNNKVNHCLDIGFAYGTLLLFTQLNTNCNSYGFDFMKFSSDELLVKYNINRETLNIEMEDVSKYNRKFDLIILTEIVEHFNFKIIPTLRKIKDLLTDHGVIMFSTPDSLTWGKVKDSYNSWKDMPDINQKTEVKDEHIYQFNLEELKEIFDVVGLKIDKLDYCRSSSILNLMRLSKFTHFNIQLSKI